MLIRCEAQDIARSLDQREVDAALPKIVAWAETKTHCKFAEIDREQAEEDVE